MMDHHMTSGGGQSGDINTSFCQMNVNAHSFVPNVGAQTFVPGGVASGGGGGGRGYSHSQYGGYPMHGE